MTTLIISIIIGLIVGLVYAMILKGELKSVHANDSASDYTRQNSFKLSNNKDIFLGTKTEKTEKSSN